MHQKTTRQSMPVQKKPPKDNRTKPYSVLQKHGIT